MDLLICLLLFGLVLFALGALCNTLSRHDLYQRRLASLNESDSEDLKARVNMKIFLKSCIGRISHLFAARSFTEVLQAQLSAAGIPLKGEEYITFCLFLIMALPLICYVLTGKLALSLIVLLSGVFLPKIYVQHKKNRRLQDLNQQLGDALLVMANALRAGFGFQQAMDTVRSELPAPIAIEFAWALREMNLGSSQEEALINLGKRVGSEDLDMVISGIIIQKQVGGNLAQILDNISNTMRERARIKREVKILTAQGKLSGLIIGLLPLALISIMLVINPEYLKIMFSDSRGLAVLTAACILEILGIVIIKKIIDIDL